MPDAAVPLFAFDRPGKAARRVACALVGVLTSVVVFFLLVVITEGGIPGTQVRTPWMLHDTANFMNDNAWVPVTTLCLAGAIAGTLLGRFLRPRTGRVELWDDRVVVGESTFPWSALQTFDDASSKQVTLFVRAGKTVETIILAVDESQRAALLAELDRRGLVRHGA